MNERSASAPPRGGSAAGWQSLPGLLELTALALMVVGVVARVAPFFDAERRLFWQFPTEDGYLTLTIARNVGIGNGMSIADGTIPTNGTQPLAMFLWSAGFWLVGGDRFLGVGIALGLEILLSLGVASSRPSSARSSSGPARSRALSRA